VNDHGGYARAVIRVFCVDGPIRGLQYLHRDTGHIVREQTERQYAYRVSADEIVLTDFGPCPAAHFDDSGPGDRVGGS
jgi:hypothetical protein